jgi:hypothetical protein
LRFAGYIGLPEIVIEQKVREWLDKYSRFRPNEVKIQFFCDYNFTAEELLIVQGAWSSMDGD